ncbi:MAG: shikimate dehydrogenase [Chloroflexota bacterium]
MISGNTKICGLIGDPVGHSVSPVMHNTAFSKLGLDYIYIPFRVEAENLARAIDGLKAFNIRGLNVTIPHKVAVIPLLDELEPLAGKIGAVNIIVNNNGILKGYNTDAGGFLKALLERGVEPKGKKAVILGAGGASRAISFTLAERGAEIVILNRKLEMNWAVELATSISQSTAREVKALELNEKNLSSVMEAADILVNATSVGMNPDSNNSPLPARLLKPDLVVFDVVYNPLKTRLLAEAEAAGAETISGIEMLVWQGALAFELWTGVKAPIYIMKTKAIEALNYED